MPRKLSLDQTSLESNGAIGVQLGLHYVDEDGTVMQSTALRRIIDPNGDIDQNVADLNSYLVANKYPEISAAQVSLLKALDAAARADPEIEAARAQWLAAQPAPPTPEE